MRKIKENRLKALLTAAMGCLCAYLGQLLIPAIVLCVMMAVDYTTGIMKSWILGTLSSKVGIRGILKKLGYLGIVATGMAVDWVIRKGCTVLGVNFGADFLFAIILIVWLIVNECISVLENLSQAGVPVPKFLTKIVGRLKNGIEEKGGDNNENQ